MHLHMQLNLRILIFVGRRYYSDCPYPAHLNSSESIWPPPLSTRVYINEEPPPVWSRGAERHRNLAFSVYLVSAWGCGAAPTWKLCRSAHVQMESKQNRKGETKI